MTGTPDKAAEAALDPGTRDRLLADPALILGDRELMRALVAAREAELGGALPESPRFASASDVELAHVDRPESLPGTIIADARRPSAGSSFGLGLATPCRDGCGAPVGIAL